MSELQSDDAESVSYLTESETESEPGSGSEQAQSNKKNADSIKHLTFAEKALQSCNNVGIENALRLNDANQAMLVQLRNNLQDLLNKCVSRQKEVDSLIVKYRERKKPREKHSKTYGYICGQPYFKDEELYPGPHNDDYLNRKNKLREYFPLDDFELAEPHWHEKDKNEVLKAVQLQIIDYLQLQIALKIKKCEDVERDFYDLMRRGLPSKKLPQLFTLSQTQTYQWGAPFKIDWMKISNINLNQRHSASACIAMWESFLRPDIVKNSVWAKKEEEDLSLAVEKLNNQDWDSIAALVPGRSPYQCFVYYQMNFSKISQVKHSKWTSKEDEVLWAAIEENKNGGNILWNRVVEKVPYRNKIQCYNRYMFTLRPDQNKREAFSKQEDCTILAFVAQYGEKFNLWPQDLLPGRNSRQIWCRYNHTLKFVNKHNPWTYEDDLKLVQFVKDHKHIIETNGNLPWATAAKQYLANKHTRMSCRTRYLTIEKYFAANPNLTLESVPRKPKRLSSIVTKENWHQQLAVAEDKVTAAERKDKIARQKNSTIYEKIIEGPATTKLKEAFKYAYKCDFSNNVMQSKSLSPIETKKVLQQIGGPENYDAALDKAKSNFSDKEYNFQKKVLLIPNQPTEIVTKRLPLNWNTVSGLRGVILHAKETRNVELKVDSVVEKEKYLENLGKFKDRFQKIFSWPIILSKLKILKPDQTEDIKLVDILEDPNPTDLEENPILSSGEVVSEQNHFDEKCMESVEITPMDDPSRIIVTNNKEMTYFGQEPPDPKLIQEIMNRANNMVNCVNHIPSRKIVFKIENMSQENNFNNEGGASVSSNPIVYNVEYYSDNEEPSQSVPSSSNSMPQEDVYEDVGLHDSAAIEVDVHEPEQNNVAMPHEDHIEVEEVSRTDVHVVYDVSPAEYRRKQQSKEKYVRKTRSSNFKPYQAMPDPVDPEVEKQKNEKKKQAIKQLVQLIKGAKKDQMKKGNQSNVIKEAPKKNKKASTISKKAPTRSKMASTKSKKALKEKQIVLDTNTKTVFEIQELTPERGSTSNKTKERDIENIADFVTPERKNSVTSDDEFVEVFEIIEDSPDKNYDSNTNKNIKEHDHLDENVYEHLKENEHPNNDEYEDLDKNVYEQQSNENVFENRDENENHSNENVYEVPDENEDHPNENVFEVPNENVYEQKPNDNKDHKFTNENEEENKNKNEDGHLNKNEDEHPNNKNEDQDEKVYKQPNENEDEKPNINEYEDSDENLYEHQNKYENTNENDYEDPNKNEYEHPNKNQDEHPDKNNDLYFTKNDNIYPKKLSLETVMQEEKNRRFPIANKSFTTEKVSRKTLPNQDFVNNFAGNNRKHSSKFPNKVITDKSETLGCLQLQAKLENLKHQFINKKKSLYVPYEKQEPSPRNNDYPKRTNKRKASEMEQVIPKKIIGLCFSQEKLLAESGTAIQDQQSGFDNDSYVLPRDHKELTSIQGNFMHNTIMEEPVFQYTKEEVIVPHEKNESKDELNAVDFIDALNRMYDYNLEDDDYEDEDFLIQELYQNMEVKKQELTRIMQQSQPGPSREIKKSVISELAEPMRKSELPRVMEESKAGPSKKQTPGLLRKIIDLPIQEVKYGGITIKRVKKT